MSTPLGCERRFAIAIAIAIAVSAITGTDADADTEAATVTDAVAVPAAASGTVPSTPAFWAASGDPASPISVVARGEGLKVFDHADRASGGLLLSRENQAAARPPGLPPLTFFEARPFAGTRLREKRQGRHARGRPLSRVTSRSPFRVEKTPNHGSDVVEESEGCFGRGGVDDACTKEKLKVGVDLLCRAVGDAVVVHAVTACPPGTLGDIGRNR